MDDLIRAQGYLALGTRLKRIAETLQSQSQVILDANTPQSPPASHHAVLMALTVHGPLSIGSLAAALRQSQPGVTRMVSKLTALGLTERQADPQDQRISRIALTAYGAETVADLKEHAWAKVEQAVASACASPGDALLKSLEVLERALETQPLHARADASLTVAAQARSLADSAYLDRPVWSALTTRQKTLSCGGAAAKRFRPDISPFAACGGENADSLKALGALIAADRPEDRVYLMQSPPILLPDELTADKAAQCVQLIKCRPSERAQGQDAIVPLTTDHWPEMTALADLTKPGPFMKRTPEMGAFWGIFRDGRLAAMAGQRLAMPGHVEVSGVCTLPDFGGQGLAASLSDHVARTIQEQGNTPFLHAWADNHGAIRLYQRLGFDIRTTVNVAIVKRKT